MNLIRSFWFRWTFLCGISNFTNGCSGIAWDVISSEFVLACLLVGGEHKNQLNTETPYKDHRSVAPVLRLPGVQGPAGKSHYVWFVERFDKYLEEMLQRPLNTIDLLMKLPYRRSSSFWSLSPGGKQAETTGSESVWWDHQCGVGIFYPFCINVWAVSMLWGNVGWKPHWLFEYFDWQLLSRPLAHLWCPSASLERAARCMARSPSSWPVKGTSFLPSGDLKTIHQNTLHITHLQESRGTSLKRRP